MDEAEEEGLRGEETRTVGVDDPDDDECGERVIPAAKGMEHRLKKSYWQRVSRVKDGGEYGGI